MHHPPGFRSGGCEFSARLFRPLCDRCSAVGIMSRFAALYERSLSVIIRLDLRLCFFSSLTNSHLAAFVSRRVYMISSRTYPSWSTARHSWSLLPLTEMTIWSRCQTSFPEPFRRSQGCPAPSAFPQPAAGSTKTGEQPHGVGNDLPFETAALIGDGRRAPCDGLSNNRSVTDNVTSSLLSRLRISKPTRRVLRAVSKKGSQQSLHSSPDRRVIQEVMADRF